MGHPSSRPNNNNKSSNSNNNINKNKNNYKNFNKKLSFSATKTLKLELSSFEEEACRGVGEVNQKLSLSNSVLESQHSSFSAISENLKRGEGVL